MARQTFSSRSTESFRQLLLKSGGSLVVSTYQAGQLVLVRANPAEAGVNTHFVAQGKVMGVAWHDDQLSVGADAHIVTYRNLPAVGPKTGQGDIVDACYLPRGTHVTGAIDVHEMGYAADGTLWFVNTLMSCLCVAEPQFSFSPRWRPPFISAYELSDRCHLNGLGFRDGQPRYVTILGNADSAGGWRGNKVSGGLVMDISDNRILTDNLCMPHSPRWYRGKLWFLSSGAGQLMSLEPGGRPQVVTELPGFARGMDFIDRYALVGLSQVRESAVFAGLPLTRRVTERKSGVWVVDLESGEVVAFLEFTGAVQEVFDLRVLPHRFPALIDSSSPLVTSSYELPQAVLENLAPPDPLQDMLAEATALHLSGQLDAAIEKYLGLLAMQPDHRLGRHQLGLCLVDAQHWEQAVAQLADVVADQPDNAEAMNSLGLAWARLGDHEQALHWLDRSIATDGQFALAHFNRGVILLKLGQYEEGWREYEWRWQTQPFVPFQCDQPRWQGEDISGQRLLVHSEQGNGDHLQFMRFLPLAAKRCKALLYVGPENLAPLANEIEGVAESRVPGQIPADRFDVYCPLMSLPLCLGITLDNLPAPERYLTVPPQVVVSQLKGDFKVGLAWAGSPTYKDDKRRSLALAQLGPLLKLENCNLFSLQMPLSSDDRAVLQQHGVTDLEPQLPGYARTAALIDQLDLVISSCTAVAHLACALGKTTAILLNYDADWRWLQGGDRSPWYPTARLYRQRTEGDWDEVIARVAVDIRSGQLGPG